MSTENALTLESLLADLQSQEPAAIVKTASAAEPKSTSSVSERLAQALTKTASETQTTGDNSPMNNTQVGNAIARQILTKLAEEGVNAVQTQTGAMVAQQDLSSAPTPVAGSVTEVAKALLARGAANGGVSPDSLLDNAVGQADETMSQIPLMTSDGSMIESMPCDLDQEAYEDEVEKVAAVATLIDAGIDFNDAVYLVKQAEEAIASDEVEQIKIASVNALMSEGVDMASAVMATEDAIELMKMAAEGSSNLPMVVEQPAAAPKGVMAWLKANPKKAIGALAGAGLLAGGAAYGAKKYRDSKTAEVVMSLVNDHGVDFDSAVAMVKQAEQDEGATYTDAYLANVKSQLRGTGEGLAGGVGGAAAALGSLAALRKVSPRAAVRLGKSTGLGRTGAEGFRNLVPASAVGLGSAGLLGGVVHGQLASVRNSLNDQREIGRTKTASALEGLVEAGHTVEDALALLGIR